MPFNNRAGLPNDFFTSTPLVFIVNKNEYIYFDFSSTNITVKPKWLLFFSAFWMKHS